MGWRLHTMAPRLDRLGLASRARERVLVKDIGVRTIGRAPHAAGS
jgi:hypothetical protein